jgi:Fe2+ or Zn2+ uptake regulation protein
VKDPEQLDLFSQSIPWEEAKVEAQEAKEAETPAEKRERRQNENYKLVLWHFHDTPRALSAFEVSEHMRIWKVDIKPEQVRAAMQSLKKNGAIHRCGPDDPLAPRDFDPRRYTLG